MSATRQALQAIVDRPGVVNANGIATFHFTASDKVAPNGRQASNFRRYRTPTWENLVKQVKRRYKVDWN
jgi:hypothetical protein